MISKLTTCKNTSQLKLIASAMSMSLRSVTSSSLSAPLASQQSRTYLTQNLTKTSSSKLLSSRNLFLFSSISIALFMAKKFQLSSKELSLISEQAKLFSSKAAMADDLFTDIHVPQASKLQEGEMLEVKVGEGQKDKVLLAKIDGKFYASGNYCTHFGAPLAKSLLVDDMVICPWHNAGFNVRTGEPQQAPALKGLPIFEVQLQQDGSVIIKVPKDLPKVQNKILGKRDPNNDQKYVIVGGGPSGVAAAQTLRRCGFTGRIIIVSAENVLPYDRTILSKAIKANVKNLSLRSQKFYSDNDIQLMLGRTVVSVNGKEKKAILQDGTVLEFNKLLAATGGIVRAPPIKGTSLRGVQTLRNQVDFGRLRQQVKAINKIVVVGASFIGMELAANIKSNNPIAQISLVDFFQTPYQPIFGAQVGKGMQKWSESKGLNFHLGVGVSQIMDDGNGHVKGVKLVTGQVLDCQMVIVGAGIYPLTGYLKKSDVKFLPDSSVAVNEYFQAGNGIFASGDIASYPDPFKNNQLSRVQHWNFAIQTGEYAALGMLGKRQKFHYVPFFWTRIWDKSIAYFGNCKKWDEVHVDGEISDKKQEYIAYYLRNNKIEAVSGMGKSRQLILIGQAMKLGLLPTGTQIKSKDFKYEDLQKKVKEAAKKGKSGCRKCSHHKKVSN